MRVAFANAKATHIFSAKIIAKMPYLMIKVLTIRQLTTSLVLINWAQVLSGALTYLRNRFMLVVICCLEDHCLEVSHESGYITSVKHE